MEWREPPPKRASHNQPGAVNYYDLAGLLRKRPGKWVMAKAYTSPKPSGGWGNYVKLRLQALLGVDRVEVRSAWKEGRGEVFARFVK